nr:MAG TPA: helix-turn-helix domain protein [Caudoviricetes sp.]
MLKNIPFYASLLNRELANGKITKHSHVLVYGAIETHALGDYGCIASNKTIAAETGLAYKTVANIISELNASGWVKVNLDEQHHRVNVVPMITINIPTFSQKSQEPTEVNPAPADEHHLTRRGTLPTPADEDPLHPPMNIEYSNRNNIEYSNRNTLLVRKRTSEVSKTSAEAAEIVENMHEMIKKRLPNRANKKRTQAQLQKDIETIEKIHRLDGYSYAEINAVMKWSQEDDFWSQNILSTAKLRKQFDKLVLRMRTEQKKKRDNIAFI